MTAIHNVIFDFGNVLLKWEPAAALVSRYSKRTIERFLTDSVSGFYGSNDIGDGGGSLAEQRAYMVEHGGEDWAKVLDWYFDHFEQSIPGEVDGARQLILDLKAAGYGVYGLSNWQQDLYPRAVEKASILKLLDDKVVSGYIKLRKPFPEIYRYALNQFGLEPASAVFVDDRLNNVEGAAAVGLHSFQFADPWQARAALIELGFNVPAVQEV